MLMNSFAADGITNLTLECQTLWGDIIPNEEWNIYKVAELQDDGTCELYGDFAQYPVSFEDFSASELTDIARTLENYVVLDNVAPYASGVSDDNGEVFFNDVPNGIYLLLGKYIELNDMLYSPSPFIVSVNYEGDGEPMELFAYAKYTVMSTSSYGRYSVVKQFGNIASEPTSPDAFVTIEIYCDGNLYETVELNAENKWTYSWESDDYHDWRVKEINVPVEYYVNYSRDRATLIVVNTKKKVFPGNDILTTTVPTTTETTVTTSTTKTNSTSKTIANVTTTITTNAKLPQTGQLWWPIPVLSIAGMVFLSAGLVIRNKDSE
ncbi:MAG: Cna B-type domain-containing protein [Ruminococcus sp.]|nr:Cna B-type domain-containing protein [Ruminococcus sp.]